MAQGLMRIIPFILSMSLCIGTVAPATPPIDLLLGHFEVHIQYEPTPGNADAGWRFSVSFDEDDDFLDAVGITRLDPSAVRLLAAPGTLQAITTATANLGPVGEPLWQLPARNLSGQLYLGMRTVIPPGIFQTSVNGNFSPVPPGNIILEITSVTGTGPQAGGHFAMWEIPTLDDPEFHFDTSDGLDAHDRLEPVPTGSHTHYNWGMTRPGNYDVTFRASGRILPWLDNGNQLTRGSATFRFVAPFSSSVANEASLNLSEAGDKPASLFCQNENCEYAPNLVALLAGELLIESETVPYGFRLNLQTDSDAATSRIGLPDPLPVRVSDGIGLADPPLEILRSEGPGELLIHNEGDGSIVLVASEPGIHRVTVRANFREFDSGNLIHGTPFQLTLLADMPPDYGYATYADSFERQHQLTTGSLDNPQADFDADGISNHLEYQLVWHGLDPAVADAQLLPKATWSDGSWCLKFIRDTYKDDLRFTDSGFAAALSSDLHNWQTWHARSGGKPDDPVFETGVDQCPIGRVMERQLILETPDPQIYFRFQTP